MPQIKSIPHNNPKNKYREIIASGFDEQYRFGYYEMKNRKYRDKQEDALTWQTLEPQTLETQNLTPIELAHRLWTSHLILDKSFLTDTTWPSGSTASTTVYDGKGNIITATLGDPALFAVVYNKNGNACGVVRLNSITHKPEDKAEKERIIKAGGTVVRKNKQIERAWGLYRSNYTDIPRVEGDLAVSRAIGDPHLKGKGVCAEATIDITSVDQIAEKLNIKREDIGKIQVIATCDGFTDAAPVQTKEGHEEYLLKTLQKIKSVGKKTERELAELLVKAAKKDGSTDNISVAIQSIFGENTPPFLLGLYDGHGGSAASTYAATNINRVFTEQCALTPQDYVEQEFSVVKKQEIYDRDHPASAVATDSQSSKNKPQSKVDKADKEDKEIFIASIKGFFPYFINEEPKPEEEKLFYMSLKILKQVEEIVRRPNQLSLEQVKTLHQISCCVTQTWRCRGNGQLTIKNANELAIMSQNISRTSSTACQNLSSGLLTFARTALKFVGILRTSLGQAGLVSSSTDDGTSVAKTGIFGSALIHSREQELSNSLKQFKERLEGLKKNGSDPHQDGAEALSFTPYAI